MPARRTDSAARPTRRRILLATGGVVLAASAGWGGNWLAAYKRHARSNVGTLGFRNRLRIPELLDPRAFDGGARRYKLELAPGSSEFLPGRKTATWGANGPYLAPTLRMRDGDPVALTVRNALPEPTTLHWHGMHLPPAMDGGPHQMVAPGAVWRPRWTVHQPASTLWYHPHPHGSTGSHVYRGIAGMIIVDDAVSDRSGLPSAYGVDDIPLVLQDKNFHDDGALDFTESTFADTLAGVDSLGLLGDTILVNGTHDPHFEVTTERVRLRLLNGSNARVYELGFPGDKTFHLAATENGLLKRPLALTRLRLAPGERAEIVVSFTAGEKALLRSFPPELGVGFPVDRFAGATTPSTCSNCAPPRASIRPRRFPPGSTGPRPPSPSPPTPGPGASASSAPGSTTGRWTWSASTRSCRPGPPRSGRSSAATATSTPSTSMAPPSTCWRSTGRSRPPISAVRRTPSTSPAPPPSAWRSGSTRSRTSGFRTCTTAMSCATRTTA